MKWAKKDIRLWSQKGKIGNFSSFGVSYKGSGTVSKRYYCACNIGKLAVQGKHPNYTKYCRK
jgi:hypothetical protein